jgi:hypothetical protein
MTVSTKLGALFVLILFAASLRAERIYVVYEHSMMWIDAETGSGGIGMGGGVDYDIGVSPDRHTLYHLAGEQLALRDPQTLDNFQGFDTTFAVPHRLRCILPAKSRWRLHAAGPCSISRNCTVPQHRRTWPLPRSIR